MTTATDLADKAAAHALARWEPRIRTGSTAVAVTGADVLDTLALWPGMGLPTRDVQPVHLQLRVGVKYHDGMRHHVLEALVVFDLFGTPLLYTDAATGQAGLLRAARDKLTRQLEDQHLASKLHALATSWSKAAATTHGYVAPNGPEAIRPGDLVAASTYKRLRRGIAVTVTRGGTVEVAYMTPGPNRASDVRRVRASWAEVLVAGPNADRRLA